MVAGGLPHHAWKELDTPTNGPPTHTQATHGNRKCVAARRAGSAWGKGVQTPTDLTFEKLGTLERGKSMGLPGDTYRRNGSPHFLGTVRVLSSFASQGGS